MVSMSFSVDKNTEVEIHQGSGVTADYASLSIVNQDGLRVVVVLSKNDAYIFQSRLNEALDELVGGVNYVV